MAPTATAAGDEPASGRAKTALEKDLRELERLLKVDQAGGGNAGGAAASASTVKEQLRSVLRKLMEAYFTPLNGAYRARSSSRLDVVYRVDVVRRRSPPARARAARITPTSLTRSSFPSVFFVRSAQARDAIAPRALAGRAQKTRGGLHRQRRVLRPDVRAPPPPAHVRRFEVRPSSGPRSRVRHLGTRAHIIFPDSRAFEPSVAHALCLLPPAAARKSRTRSCGRSVNSSRSSRTRTTLRCSRPSSSASPSSFKTRPRRWKYSCRRRRAVSNPGITTDTATRSCCAASRTR